MDSQADNKPDKKASPEDAQSSVDANGVSLEEAFESDAQADALDNSVELDSESSQSTAPKEEDMRAKYLRALADLENFKKRSAKERSELIKYSGESVIRDLLEVVDSLELALNHSGDGDSSETIKGVGLILDRFLQILGQHSIRSISVMGEEFDPNTHNALSTVPTKDHKPGTVIEEFKKAYYYKDKLIRPGQAVVSAAIAEVEDGGAVMDEEGETEE